MKKILAGILALVAFSSCSLEDNTSTENNNNIYNTNILGVWKIQTEYQVSGNNIEIIINESVPDNCKKKSTYEFKNDGKYYVSDYNSIISGCVQSEATLPYLYSSAQMKLTINNNEAEVLELNLHKLVVLTPAYYDYNGDSINDYVKTVFYK
ncbi:MAG: lipocalin family protein [Chryseobacterium jejuense]|uniref:lipocalin family protein n=1 Tax=Chryseobacterium jejuense TaxID=445960 RepID=UPI003D0FE667